MIRVSKERDGMTSPEVQRHAIEQYAARQNIDITEWVEGLDESGSQARSAWWPRLDYAIGKIENAEADVILVWKFSRVGRRRVRWAVALDRVDTAGGAIESATEQADATPSGRLQRGMMGEFNAYQAELIGETWREAHSRRVRNGLPPTGGHRFGYRRENGTYLPDPETGPILRDLYLQYLGGIGYAALTRILNEGGHTDGRARWTYQGVVRMLDSGFAAGLLGRTVVFGGKRRTPPPWERTYDEGAHEPIVTNEEWAAYVARRQQAGGTRTQERAKYLLAGLARCGDCGSSMHGKSNPNLIYMCSRASNTTGMKKVSIDAKRVDQAVMAWLFEFASDTDVRINAAAANRKRRDDSAFIIRRSTAIITKADERLAALTIKLADGTITDAAYKAAAELIEAERATAAAAVRSAAVNPVHERAPARVPKDIAMLWSRLTTDERNVLLRSLIDRVEIAPAKHRGDISPRWKIVPQWEA
ncbi:recombinase family protein [Microbacterium sp. MYb64]|uniref:recombinase family protein n=1 Tax=Microbacterium sp. MYb64 TaxID=1848691 RepID=UPI000CFC715A|nr:recombinase family protein [Microbacterium sp. MYb64]PRB08802.1 hypothetical protein CQ044_00055 [Microbacterium sp. MYb64]